MEGSLEAISEYDASNFKGNSSEILGKNDFKAAGELLQTFTELPTSS
jgi:hypothetical protein